MPHWRPGTGAGVIGTKHHEGVPLMFCQRCDKPLTDDEAERITHAGATGPGSTITVCRVPCRPTPRQTYPIGLGR